MVQKNNDSTQHYLAFIQSMYTVEVNKCGDETCDNNSESNSGTFTDDQETIIEQSKILK